MNQKEDSSKEKTALNKLKIIYLIVLIILLIFTFIVSFKTGESIYYLVNTNPEDKNTNAFSNIAEWNFSARIEY